MTAKKFVLLVALILSSALCLSAQEAPCSTRTLLVNVLDQKGWPVNGLGRERFRAKYRGHAVEITSVADTIRPRRVVLLLDASGSMQDGWQSKTEQMLAADVVRDGIAGTSFALMVFSSRVQDETNFAQNSDILAKKVKHLSDAFEAIPKNERKTALFDTIIGALDELSPARPGDIVYALTDGGDNTSVHRAAEVERRLLAAGVRLFAFLLVDSPMLRGRTAEETQGPGVMSELCRHTGGVLASFASSRSTPHSLSERDLARIIVSARTLYPIMRRSYDVKIKMPAGIDKPRDWDLEVEEGGKKVRYNLIYPRLSPCVAPEPKG